METDFWAYQYLKNPKVDEVEDEDFDLEQVLKDMETNPCDWEDAAPS